VAKEFNISREAQDKYAVESYRRAEAADKAGLFADELVPITVKKDGKEILIDRDEIRYGTTYEKIAKLPGAFKEYGDRSTAGNSSQVTDGAAALLLMKRSKALELGQPILAKYVGTTLAGLPPRIMGIGPSIAIPKILAKYNLDLNKDIDVIELNEAFSSMAVYCRDKLGLDWSKMNPRGGAIALGHPFGMTGVRQIVSGLSECRRQKKKVLLTSMCLGTGMGMAGLFVNEMLDGDDSPSKAAAPGIMR
jgi:acetyl-CoA acetyltransferase family protein